MVWGQIPLFRATLLRETLKMAVNIDGSFFFWSRDDRDIFQERKPSDPHILWINGGVKQLGVSVNGGTPISHPKC